MEPRTFDVTGRLHLRMRIRSADIRIRETDSTSATVHVTGERKADEISIEGDASPSGTRLQVVERKGAGGWGFRGGTLQVDAEVPTGTVIEVATGSGDLIVEGTIGELTFQSASGDAHIGAVTGSARLQTASGDVRVGSIGGEAEVMTASGDFRIGSIDGSLMGRSVSGDIDVARLGGTGQNMSASGDITIGSANADLSLRSVSGDIDVGVPTGMRVWFDLSSTSGDTVSNLDPTEGDDDAGPAFEIRATTVSGDIRIRRAASRDTLPV